MREPGDNGRSSIESATNLLGLAFADHWHEPDISPTVTSRNFNPEDAMNAGRFAVT